SGRFWSFVTALDERNDLNVDVACLVLRLAQRPMVPLLLNPLNPSGNGAPGQHLRYGVGGCVVALDDSAMGKCSINVYRLDRGNLRKRRQKAQEDARREYYSILMRQPGPSRDAELKEMLDSYSARRAGRADRVL